MAVVTVLAVLFLGSLFMLWSTPAFLEPLFEYFGTAATKLFLAFVLLLLITNENKLAIDVKERALVLCSAVLQAVLNVIRAFGDVVSAKTQTPQQPRAAQPPQPSVKCEVCLEMFPNKKVVVCRQCPSVCCNVCMGKHLKRQVEDHCIELKCPSCPAILSEGVLVEHMSPFLRRQWQNQKNQPKTFVCPSCKGECRDAKYSTRSVTCTKCNTSWCLDCREKYHYLPSSTCRDREFRKWRTSHDVQPCPKCRCYIEKNEGSLSMHCIVCKFRFCWKCREEWTNSHACRRELNRPA